MAQASPIEIEVNATLTDEARETIATLGDVKVINATKTRTNDAGRAIKRNIPLEVVIRRELAWEICKGLWMFCASVAIPVVILAVLFWR